MNITAACEKLRRFFLNGVCRHELQENYDL